jgi:hypothetical protein
LWRRDAMAASVGLLLACSLILAAPPPTDAALGACGSGNGTNHHVGMALPATVTPIKGGQAYLEYVNFGLCVSGGSPFKSFASSWVALTALSPNDPKGYDIFQIGFFRCQNDGWSGCTTSVTNWFYAYGREQSATCGAELAPDAALLGSASTATYAYKIDRTVDETGRAIYAGYINSVDKIEEDWQALDSCWLGGPKRAAYQDEIFDPQDQSGGSVSNSQTVGTVKHHDGDGVWRAMNVSLDVPCPNLPDQLTTQQKCQTNPIHHDAFVMWDSLVP